MTLTRWQRPSFAHFNPVRRVANFRNEVDALFNLAFGQANGNAAASQWQEAWFPAVDVYEDHDNLVVKAELPGLKKEDIEIALQDGYLTLSGDRKSENRKQEGEVHRTERVSGQFHRSVGLPFQVQEDKITATYNEGVLTVTLPKAEEAKPKQIQIKVK